ncbi:MAG TPA: adenylate/guanylate cyclase domain-containing protein [Burkholderiales bacterium]|nr:adenylate/guanylate cyclase domain-containing protein [Burkholderiales bacterium]
MAQKPERRPAAILFIELRNFTRLSEVLQPETVLELVNEFFSLAARAIKSHSGKVLSVHNDGLVSAFVEGKPVHFNDAAIKTAQVIQTEFAPVGERWQKDYGLPAAASSGVHTGETLFGYAGPEGQQQFVGFGDSVSIAERLVHRARAGEIVISLDVMKALRGAVKTLGAKELTPLELGGKRPPLPIYGMILETRLDFT